MIPFTSCVCPAKKSMRQVQRPSEKQGSTVQESDEDAIRLQLKEPCDPLSRHPTYHWQEWYLSRQRFQGPVITPLTSIHLLDNCYNAITQALLKKCNSWYFNTFSLDISTRGRSLTFLLVHLFHEYGFINHFQLDIMKVWRCFKLMEASYHRHNPYHNSVHAADVTQAMHCFLQESKFRQNLTPLEAMGSIIAAVAHDLDHPGVTQTFLVATSNHLVNLYHNKSVLENHHWRTAISCIVESGIFSDLKTELWKDLQKQIKSLILATDITRQKEFLSKFQGYLSTQTLDMKDVHYRHFALQIALKCADLCNPCRPWVISQRWSYQVCQEFYKQGLFEHQLDLPVTEVFDCNKAKVPKIQTDFLQHVVIPLFETWNAFMDTELSNNLLKNLYHNYNQWQNQMNTIQNANESPEDCSMAHVTACNTEVVTKQCDVILLNTDKYFKRPSENRIQLNPSTTEEFHAFINLLSLSSTKPTIHLRKICAEIEAKTMLSTVFPDDIYYSGSSSSQCSSKRKKCETSTHCNNDTANNSQNCSQGKGCCPSSPPSQRKGQKSIKEYHEKIGCQPNSILCIVVEAFNENKCVEVKDPTHCSNAPQKIHLPNKTCKSSLLSSGNSNSNCPGYHNTIWAKSNTPKNQHCSTKNTSRFTMPSKLTASLCWHIKRSISAERSQLSFRNFDIPLPTKKGCKACNKTSHRRGSAPAHITSHRNNSTTSDLSLGTSLTDSWNRGKFSEVESCSTGRRWSMPMEPTPS